MTSHKDALKLNLSPSNKGRVYVGLSWDDIYEHGAGQGITESDISAAKIQSLPKIRLVVVYILVLALGLCAALALGSEIEIDSIMSFRLRYVLEYIFYIDTESINTGYKVNSLYFCMFIAHALFITALLITISMPNFFLLFSQKNIDRPERDKDFKNFDIDLHCFIYDENKNLVTEINPESKNLVTEDGAVYHSGEESDGAGVFDDETIHIETINVPDNYHYFVFCVSNDCAHSFDKIRNLKIRLVDSQSETTLYDYAISSGEFDGFSFCVLHKTQDGWVCRKIEKYLPFTPDWQESIRALL